MNLAPRDWDITFRPSCYKIDSLSNGLNIFQQEDYELFDITANLIHNKSIKARLFDILYCASGDKGKYAKKALNAYTDIPIDAKLYFSTGGTYYIRTLELAAKSGKNGKSELLNIVAKFINVINDKKQCRNFVYELSRMLKSTKLTDADKTTISANLKRISEESANAKEHFYSSLFYSELISWGNTQEEKDNARFNMADQHLLLARSTRDIDVSYIYAQCGVSEFLSLSDKAKIEHNIYIRMPNEIRFLHDRKSKLQDYFKTCTILEKSKSDVTAAYDYLKNVSPNEIVHIFSLNYPIINDHGISAQAASCLSLPLALHIPIYVVNRNGNQLARVQPEDEATIEHLLKMEAHFATVSARVINTIYPQLLLISDNNLLQEALIRDIVCSSPIIPETRRQIVINGFLAGFREDFTTAMHLLVPQLENIIRLHLQNAQSTTAVKHDINSSENEMALGSLLDRGYNDGNINADVYFELSYLFADKFGANIRNELAHGLLDHQETLSVHFIYGFWLIFKLVYISHYIKSAKLNECFEYVESIS